MLGLPLSVLSAESADREFVGRLLRSATEGRLASIEQTLPQPRFTWRSARHSPTPATPAALAFLLIVVLAEILSAQTGTLRGRVADESGAFVPGAQVTITGAGVNHKTAADETGVYSFAGLLPGNYLVAASAPNLVTPQPTKVSIKSAAATTLNLVLKVASTKQQLNVEDNAAPAVSTDAGANAGALILRDEDLQALSDNPDDLAADLQALAGPSAGPNGGSIFIDGFSGGELPPKESIREIRINQNPFSAEFDKLGYGRIEILTKPGTNKYRGTVDYNLGTGAWNARNPYSPTKAPLLLNEFEGNGSGPLGKRASFTLDAQRNMVDNGSIVNAVALDPANVPVPLSQVFKTLQRFTRLSPRLDYRLNDNNTLSLRYMLTTASIDGSGIGSFDLIARGYRLDYTHQTLQASETAVMGITVNETRFQYYRAANHTTPRSTDTALDVLGSFSQGGVPAGAAADTQNSFELTNATSMAKGKHFLRIGVRLRGQMDDNVAPTNFNGTFTFGGGLAPALDGNNQPIPDAALVPISSIERYRRTLLNLPGGGATQYSRSAGIPGLAVHQFDLGAFIGDDWRVRPNLTVSTGLRWENQTNISDHRDFAPRVAIAWAPSSGKKSPPKTVVRMGFGAFYDRFPLASTLTAQRFNGVVQQQVVVTNPAFFPTPETVAQLSTFQTSPVMQEISSRLRSPYILQSAVSIERQLPAKTTLAVTYTNSHGVHLLRTQDINAPLPGTYDRSVQGSGVFPHHHPGPVFLMESSGIYNQNQLVANVNSRMSPAFSLFGFYVLNKAMSNTDGLGTVPANPYDYRGEYGPASTDVRHRVTVGGSLSTRWSFRLSPFVILQSGPPFDLTAGNDLFGTTLFNGRPGIANNPAKPGLIQTSYGLLDPNPTPDEQIVSRNFGRGPGSATVNLRLAKTIGFGPEPSGSTARSTSSGSPSVASGGMAVPGGGGGGGGMRGVIGTTTTRHRFNLIISMSVRNLLNHNNPGPMTGNITSPLFGRANRVAGNVNGEGFSENASNRRLELQIRLNF